MKWNEPSAHTRPSILACGDAFRGSENDVDLIADFLERRRDVEGADARLAAFVLVHASEGLIEAVSERPDVNASDIALNAAELIARFVEKRRDGDAPAIRAP